MPGGRDGVCGTESLPKRKGSRAEGGGGDAAMSVLSNPHAIPFFPPLWCIGCATLVSLFFKVPGFARQMGEKNSARSVMRACFSCRLRRQEE